MRRMACSSADARAGLDKIILECFACSVVLHWGCCRAVCLPVWVQLLAKNFCGLAAKLCLLSLCLPYVALSCVGAYVHAFVFAFSTHLQLPCIHTHQLVRLFRLSQLSGVQEQTVLGFKSLCTTTKYSTHFALWQLVAQLLMSQSCCSTVTPPTSAGC
ncbi:hypothetical protein COO60DRAFT_379460 [Scenedesmus sp. NREL 46B-D3]|nr:hypothetical protein COO60DRAFT_379460 [Scenedesmus sp. NREL 46B-D3]